MKKLLPLLVLPFLCWGCIDKDYNLSDINTENTTIGDESTVLDAPLAMLTVRMSELTNGSEDVQTIFEEVDLWLPSSLPDGTTWIDLVRLQNEPAYLAKLLDAFFAQTANDPVKLTRVASLVWNKYRAQVEHLLPFRPGEVITKELFTEYFITYFNSLAPLQAEIARIASDYLQNISLQDLSYRISKIDLSSDIVDMLVDNLDPKDTLDPKNTLDLYGSIVSDLPLGVMLNPDFVGTDVDFDVTVEGPGVTNALPMTRLYAEDLRTIIAGTTIRMPIRLERYYPNLGFNEQMRIHLVLQVQRRGGLKLKL